MGERQPSRWNHRSLRLEDLRFPLKLVTISGRFLMPNRNNAAVNIDENIVYRYSHALYLSAIYHSIHVHTWENHSDAPFKLFSSVSY